MDTQPAEIAVARKSNLLCSDGGIELMPEICLRVVELLAESDPKHVARLLVVSKSFNALLISSEKSVTKTIVEDDVNLVYVNGLNQKVSSSRLGAENDVLNRYTYSWLSEMKYRKEMVKFLIGNKITNMENAIDGWPSLNISKREYQLKLDWFRTRSLYQLFRLADCVTGLDTTKAVRNQQSKFLQTLSTDELACLGVMVEVIGHNFFEITRRSVIELGTVPHSLRDLSIYRSSSYHYSDQERSNDTDENWIRETMCVFEDLVQRYGPLFAWAYFNDSEGKPQRPNQWASRKIQKGLNNMNAFELGYTMSYASLQSVVWRTFSQKQRCSPENSWTIAKGLVEAEMMAYHISKK